MVTMTKKDIQYEAIEKHGRDLIAIFPKAEERDPVKLCKKLRRLEANGAALALRACNGPEYPNEDYEDVLIDSLLLKVNVLLGNTRQHGEKVPIFVNLDARGYALKIDDEYVRDHGLKIHRDWGGYGIIAPEIA